MDCTANTVAPWHWGIPENELNGANDGTLTLILFSSLTAKLLNSSIAQYIKPNFTVAMQFKMIKITN